MRGGVFDDGKGVQARPVQGASLEQITCQQHIGPAAQELGPGRAVAFRRGWDAVLLEHLPDRGGGDLDTQRRELTMDPAIPHELFSRASRRTRVQIDRTAGGRPRRAVAALRG
jgi:hypothetical protein